MFQTYSSEQFQRIVIFIGVLISMFGIDIPEGSVEAALQTVINFGVLLMTLWGWFQRWRKGDVNALGFRKLQ